MTFTYDGTAASFSTRDTVRLLIADTHPLKHVFSDEELDALIALGPGDAYTSASLALRSYASSKVRQAIMLQLPGMSVTKTEIAKQAMDLADRYELIGESNAVPLEVSMYESTDQFIDAIVGRYNLDFNAPGVQ